MLDPSWTANFPRPTKLDQNAFNELDINVYLARQLEAIQTALSLNMEIANQVERNSSKACAPLLHGKSCHQHQNPHTGTFRRIPNDVGESSLVSVFQASPIKAIRQTLSNNTEITGQLEQHENIRDSPDTVATTNHQCCPETHFAPHHSNSMPVVSEKFEQEEAMTHDLALPLIQECSPQSIDTMHSFFPDVEDIKMTVCDTLRQQIYNVEDYYHETGIWQAIARDTRFHNLGLKVILLNMFWIGFETECDSELLITRKTIKYSIVDSMFTIFFLFEILVRFLSFKEKSRAFIDKWFLFDASMVVAMILETLIMVVTSALYGFRSQGKENIRGVAALRLIRVARLARVFRAQRLLRAWSELLILIKGISAGFRSVVAVLCLLLLIIYVFGIIFVLMLKDTGAANNIFDHLHTAMHALLMQIICGPDEDLVNSLLDFDWVYYALFVVFLVIANYTVMNLLIGILCDAVSDVARDAKDQSFAEEVDSQIDRMTQQLDLDCDGYISPSEFEVMVHDPVLSAKLDELGVDIVAVADFARFIFTQSEKISYVNFANIIGQFRGCKGATLASVANLMRHITTQLTQMELHLRSDRNNVLLSRQKSHVDPGAVKRRSRTCRSDPTRSMESMGRNFLRRSLMG